MTHQVMRTAPAQTSRPGAVLIEPLEDGDTATVEVVFRQLGPQTRRWRFGAPKPRLSPNELALLACVGTRSNASASG